MKTMMNNNHIIIRHWVATLPSAVWHLETIQLVTWHFLNVLAVVVECVGRHNGGVAH